MLHTFQVGPYSENIRNRPIREHSMEPFIEPREVTFLFILLDGAYGYNNSFRTILVWLYTGTILFLLLDEALCYEHSKGACWLNKSFPPVKGSQMLEQFF